MSDLSWIFGILALVVLSGICAAAAAALASSRKALPDPVGEDSYFDGSTLQLIGYGIVSSLITTVTLGIAFPWMLCMLKRWEAKHTVIHGRRLQFNGRGGQLFGKILLWLLLTVITLGIYGFVVGLNAKKWAVAHTVYAHGQQSADSYFSGKVIDYLVTHLLAFLLTLVTFGFGAAWAKTMVLKWELRNTCIDGSPLEFHGTGGQLFVKCLLAALFTFLTLGIYALFFPVRYLKWQVQHTDTSGQAPDLLPETSAENPEPGSGRPAQTMPRKQTATWVLPAVLCAAIFASVLIFGLGQFSAAPLPHNSKPALSLGLQHVSLPSFHIGSILERLPHSADTPPAESDDPSEADHTGSIVGHWIQWSLEERGTLEESDLELTEYVFESDGTFENYSSICCQPVPAPEGASEAPVGCISYNGMYWTVGASAYFCGTYRVDEDKLVMRVEDAVWMDADSEPDEFIRTIHIDGDTLTLYDEEYMFSEEYVSYHVFASFSNPAGAPESGGPSGTDHANSIVGHWLQCSLNERESLEESELERTEYVFESNGTFESYSNICNQPVPASGGASEAPNGCVYYDGMYWTVGASAYFGGTYRMDGDKLLLRIEDAAWMGENSEPEESVLTVRIDGDTLRFYYTEDIASEGYIRQR